jgi:cytochrome P450
MTRGAAPAELAGFDLGHLGFWARPEAERLAVFAELRRREQPVFARFTNNMPFAQTHDGAWAVVRHADVVEVSRTPSLFSSEPSAASVFDIPPWLARYFDSMINMDDPRHSRIRKVVARAFSPRLLAKLDTDLRVRAGRIVDDVVAGGGGDFVVQVAQRLPTQVICDMMGIPEERYGYVLKRTDTIIGFSDPEYIGISRDYLLRHGSAGRRHVVPASARLSRAGWDLIRMVRRLGEQRLTEPRDDLISALVGPGPDGERLTPRQVGQFFILLVVAGTETTRNVIAHALRLFTEHPEQRELLLADFEPRIGPAIEEVVRYVTPVIQFRRTVTGDCELAGREFHRGDKLLLFYNSANRDETVFADPDRFDITRSPNPHVGFGGPGPHFCLGANLARQEITVMLRELFTRLPGIRAVGEPEPLLSYIINGIKRLPYDAGR